MEQYVIALDAMGGDNAPLCNVEGAVLALRRFSDVRILLAGPSAQLEPLLANAGDVRDRIEIIEAGEVIGMDESPMLAVREGRADAVVSAGSTGAVLACGMLRIGRIPGVERPALGPVLPGVKKPFILIDSGANVDCQPKYLVQFGLMGSVYMSIVLGVSDPAVGLVTIGTESEKGNRLTS